MTEGRMGDATGGRPLEVLLYGGDTADRGAVLELLGGPPWGGRVQELSRRADFAREMRSRVERGELPDAVVVVCLPAAPGLTEVVALTRVLAPAVPLVVLGEAGDREAVKDYLAPGECCFLADDDRGRLGEAVAEAVEQARRLASAALPAETMWMENEVFGLLARNSLDGVSISQYDPIRQARRLLFCNDRYVEMSGFSREELTRSPNVDDLVTVLEERHVEGGFFTCLAKGIPTRGLASWKRPDGAENYFEWVTVSWRRGGAHYLLGIDQDVTARVRAQNALRHGSPALGCGEPDRPTEVVHKDREFRYVWANEPAAKALGVHPEQVSRRTDFDFLPEDVAGRMQERDAEPMTSGRECLVHESGLDSLGRPVHWQVLRSPTRAADGRIDGVLVVRSDVTRRVEAEAALSQWAAVIRSTDDAIMALDAAGTILSWNPGAEALYGYRAGEVIGQSVALLARPGDREELLDGIGRVARGEHIHNYEVEHQGEAGAVVPVALTLSPIVGPDGEVIGVSVAGRGVGDRRRAERALRESERRFRQLVETSSDGINICRWYPETGKRRLLFCNDRFVEMSGFTREQLEEADDLNALIVTGETPEETDQVIQKLLCGAPITGVASWNRPDGRPNVHEYTALCTRAGDEYHIMGFDRNVTEREEARRQLQQYAEQLRELNQELERSNRDLEEFTYTVSHDLQEPLRKVQTFAQFLLEDLGEEASEQARDHVDRVQGAVARMRELIQHLLALARVGSHGAEMVPVESGRVLAEVLETMAGSIGECGARVVVRPPLPVVRADPVQLGQVLQNLIGNALKFRTPGERPRVEVWATIDGREACFSVADSGIGIEERFLDRIFGPFQRLHPRDRYGGAGVGLALCDKIVRRHAGRIWAESEPGHGSVFHFTVPLAAGQDERDADRGAQVGGA
jgi:PAS domain S-box-containing protein